MATVADYSIRNLQSLFIDGAWVRSTGDAVFDVVSPGNERVVAQVPLATAEDVDKAVRAARHAFDHGPWPRMTGQERSVVLKRFIAMLRDRAPEVAMATTLEMGAPITSTTGMTQIALSIYDYFADLVATFPFEEVRQRQDGGYGVVAYEPAGVTALIVPWNSPPITNSMKVAPALAAGCTVIFKCAPETPLDAYILSECIEAAGFPPGVFNMLTADRTVSERLVTHPDVDKISFTGSTAVGRRIMTLSGERIARVTLELGGKSAAIILDDVEPEEVIANLVYELTANTGQACSSLTRMIVPRRRMADYADALAAAVQAYRVGDPLDPETQVGPLAMKRQLERVSGLIGQGRSEGARLVTGGGIPAGCTRGYFIEPTIFANVSNEMTIAREEIFGPVSSLIAHDGPDDAVRIANDTIYGLHGAVFTHDPQQAYEISRHMRTGQVSCNSCKVIAVDLPMGGFKQSGIGRERGPEGLRTYLETKTIYLDQPPPSLIGR